MFVGGHVLSDTYHHYNDGVDGSINTATVGVDQVSQYISFDIAQLAKTEDGDNCCSKPQNRIPDNNITNHIHCIADCGLASTEFTLYHPNPRLYLAPPNDPAATSSTISDLFRPPIV